MADIVKLLQKQSDLYVMKGATEEDIKKAEEVLGLRFSYDYLNYLIEFGVVSFTNHEFTGVCESKRLCVINVTIEERKNVEVPRDWYVLEQTNIDGIVIWQDGNGTVYQTAPNVKAKRLCGSMEEYIAKE